jgi:hypothetical protein
VAGFDLQPETIVGLARPAQLVDDFGHPPVTGKDFRAAITDFGRVVASDVGGGEDCFCFGNSKQSFFHSCIITIKHDFGAGEGGGCSEDEGGSAFSLSLSLVQ